MKKVVGLALALCSCELSGCASAIAQHSLYWPAVPNAPMLTKKGDRSLDLHGSLIQGQASGAYAVTDHLAVRGAADGNYANGSGSADVGLGWFWSEPREEGWRGEVAADIGTGIVGDRYDVFTTVSYPCPPQAVDCTNAGSDTTTYSTRFTRASLQGDAGYQFDRVLVGGVVRLTQVSGTLQYAYNPYTVSGQTDGTTPASQTEAENWRFADAALLLRAKVSPRVSFDTELGGSIPLGGAGPLAQEVGESLPGMQHWPLILAVGLHLGF